MNERPQQPPALESEVLPDLQGAWPEKEATGDGQGGDQERDEVAEAFPDTDLSAEEEAVRQGMPRQ